MKFSVRSLCLVVFVVGVFFLHESPPGNVEVARKHYLDRFRISNVLLFKNPLSQAVLIVIIENRHSPLHDDCAVIEFLIDEMHGAACDFYAISKRLLLRLQSREGRQ